MRSHPYWFVAATKFSPCSFLASQTKEGPRRLMLYFAAHPICGPTPGIREKLKLASPELYQTSLVLSPTSHNSRLFSSKVTKLSVREACKAKNEGGKSNVYGVGPVVTKVLVPT